MSELMIISTAEAERLEALRSYQVLDTPAEQSFDDIARFAAQYFEVPVALVSLVDAERQWFKARVGLLDSEVPRSISFCDHAIRSDEVYVVEDATKNPLFAENPLVTGGHGVRFYAGAPLITPSGHRLGTLCLVGVDARHFSSQQSEVLRMLASQVVAQLQLRLTNFQIAESVKTLSLERDVQECSKAALRQSFSLLDSLTRMAPGVLYQYRLHPDGTSCFPYASAGINEMLEVDAADITETGAAVLSRIHKDDYKRVIQEVQKSAATLTKWECEFRVVLPIKGICWRQGAAMPEKLDNGSVLWHGFITDMTDRKLATERIEKLAFYDPLTELPNRRLLLERLEQSLIASRKNKTCGGLFFLDLDNFKEINDARGHNVGDSLLKEVACRLYGLLRREDIVGRLGGDEFVVLAHNFRGEKEAREFAVGLSERMRAAIDTPFWIPGEADNYRSTVSIGVTLFPRESEEPLDLVREADTAMYYAKKAGRNRVCFFEPAMHRAAEQKLELLRDLTAAVAAEKLEVHFQSQVDSSGEVHGAELLLRWTDPVRGPVPPTVFIPVAEESGLIATLGKWVLEKACETLVELEARDNLVSLSVNVSPRQFSASDFAQSVLSIITRTGANPKFLILEVTEGILIQDVESTAAKMEVLVAMGVRFSIDDFGTGYSSLAYLKKLPLYEIKIDRSFIQDVPCDPDGTSIVRSILAMARHLRLQCVAEGVETVEQAEFLTENNCHLRQGYLYARPVPKQQWMARLSPADTRNRAVETFS